MGAAEKKFILDIPLKVILTEEGASHFISHNKNLMRFKLADNIEEYGISLNHFSPNSLQNMILLDYVSKIEIALAEFDSCRQEIMDLSKVIVYSMMYKQFDHEIFKKLVSCDCVRKYNRTNPKQIIDEQTNIPERELRRALATKNAIIQQTRKTILDPIWKSIMDNKSYEPDERNIYMLMTEKFVNRLGALNWYIITKFVKDENFSQILNVLRLKLVEYMEKSRIAEYSSLMVMELAGNNENSNIKKEAKAIYNDVDDINSLVLDHSIREKIIKLLKQKKEMIYISWKLGGSSSALGKQNRLQITLYNKDDEFQEVKESIESKMSADLNKKSLIDFYQNLQDGDGQDLGLYYLTYLDDACKKVNVRFESIVNQFSSSDLTVINLIFHF